jgi:TonB-linked SusC/RagA family outer membrane protein
MKKNGCSAFLCATPIIKCLLMIKLTALLICTFSLTTLANNGFAQEKITLKLANASLRTAFKVIERQTYFRFVYNEEILPEDQKININVQAEPVANVMQKLLDKTSLTFKFVGNDLIVISTEQKQAVEARTPLEFDVSGRVVDARNSPLPNVTIQEKGTSNGTSTKEGGTFTLKVTSETAVLVISSVGFNEQEVPVNGRRTIDIVLQDNVADLNQVVVVGYGSQKRSDVTGSVASVPKSRLSEIPVTNILHAMEGSVAGVGITQNSAVPGRTASVQIRGINSIAANNSPLIVVDGLPLSQDASTNDINPNDIENIQILKDASAVAIYGVRGSNGVILITTKRGMSGKPVIRFNTYVGTEKLAHIMEPNSPEAYVQKWADYKKTINNTDTTILANAFERNNYYSGKAPVDWLDLTTQTGMLQDHNLSISGGTKDVRYYISGEYMKEKGVIRGYQYQRASVRSNLDINVTDYLTMGTSLFYANNNSDGGTANFFFGPKMSPYGTVYKANGDYEIFPMFAEQLYTNPLIGLTNNRVNRSNNFNGNGYAELKLGGVLKGLKFRLNTGYSLIQARRGSYVGRAGNDNTGTASAFYSESKNWIIENILSYTKDFGVHHIDFTGLYSAQNKDYYAMAENASGFFNDVLGFYNAGAGGTVSAAEIFRNDQGVFTGTYRDVKTNLSQMGRINYGYDSRYLLTFTARRDGSSVFGANTDKYGVFPSVAVAWNISNEKFFQPVSFVDNLKLRTSYGKTGNEAISINGTITTASTVRYPFGGTSWVGVLSNYLGNAGLHWETTKGMNFGLDFSILKNRISGSVDFYKTETEDLILKRNIPNISGYTSILDNLGKTKNTGVEITLVTQNIRTGDFRWETNINFSSYKNKIVDVYGDGKDDIGNRWFIGHPVRVIYDYKMIGVWQVGETPGWDASSKPGYLKFEDISGADGKPDGKIDDKDMIIQGSPLPDWSGGITNTFHYKNFHLNIFIQTVQGVLRNNTDLFYADEAWRLNLPKEIGYWTAENKSQTRPSLDPNARAAARGYGYPSDASYTRIKDVTLSYTMPQTILDKIKLGGLTLYASGRNLYTFTDWIGWDPEFSYDFRGGGDWQNNYPLNRTIVIGANVTLR